MSFFGQFYASVMRNFIPEMPKRFFVLTDNPDAVQQYPNVEIVLTEKKERHATMLEKNKLFLSLKRKIAYKFDYVFAPNANTRVDALVSKEEVLPDNDLGQTMVCVAHLQFANAFTNNHAATLLRENTEKNPASKAFIAALPYQYCWSNAWTGGVPHNFFDMCETITKWTQEDAANGIVPIWHDESYFNKYRLTHADKFRILPINYGLPELEYNFPDLPRKITILEKKLHGV